MNLASRARIKKNLDRIMEWQKRAHEAKEMRQTDLFGIPDKPHQYELILEEAEPWTVIEGLEAERQAIGFYLSGHPLDKFFELLDYAIEINEIKRQNDIKYGSPLLNRHRLEREERAKRNVRKFR